jgi:hypothetical protein
MMLPDRSSCCRILASEITDEDEEDPFVERPNIRLIAFIFLPNFALPSFAVNQFVCAKR